ncbi:copper resistance protein CopC [Kribbella sp. NPDC056345]|uniref:copper resistance CopC family protein n=1 Tax=Kribbella sp. NPDC056345 TaxID=3345789 RepID=UPI0035DC686C
MSSPVTSRLRSLRRSCAPILAVLAITTTLTVAPVVPAAAHSRLTASTPANGARLSATPESLSFTFDQTLQPVPSWDAVLVTGPSGARHPARSVRIEGNTLYATCDRLGAAGTYAISYRVISGDGHPIAGHITINLARPDTGTPVAAMSLPEGSVPAWLWILELATALLLLQGFRRWRSEQGRSVVHARLETTRD